MVNNSEYWWNRMLKTSSDSNEYKAIYEHYRDEIERTKGYVYLLQMVGTPYFKIGHTKYLENRLHDIQQRNSNNPVSMPPDIELSKLPSIKVIHVIETNDRYAVERDLHSLYKSCRIKYPDKIGKSAYTEWFTLSSEQVNNIKSMNQIYFNFSVGNF